MKNMKKLPKRLFSEEEIAEISMLREGKFAIHAIAAKLKRDKGLVGVYLNHPEEYARMEKQFEELPKQEVKPNLKRSRLSSIVKPSCLSEKIVYRNKNNLPKKLFTNEEEERILELRNEGFSIKKIGNALSRDRRLISFFLTNPEDYTVAKFAKESESNNTPPTPKKKSSTTPKESSVAVHSSEDDIEKFRKIPLEFRCVIKFLTKKGLTAKAVHDEMLNVYGSLAFNQKGVGFWHQQYKKGRESILNDPRKEEVAMASSSTSSGNKRPLEKEKTLFKIKLSGFSGAIAKKLKL